MHRSIEELTSDLILLPRRERLEIARFLLFLDRSSSDSGDVSASWESEIADRVRAVDDGTAVAIDYAEAMQQIADRFAR